MARVLALKGAMGDGDTIWRRDGRNVEELPDPFAAPVLEPAAEAPAEPPKRRALLAHTASTASSALLLVTLLWLIVTAPLGRALEPLDDPAMLLLSEEGRPIARRGAIKDEPVEVAELDPLTPAAFIAIEDRRFHRHWGIDPRAIGRAMVANMSRRRRPPGRQHASPSSSPRPASCRPTAALKRKAQEVIIAFWLEGWLTKDEILSRYLSSVYFGDGVYGLRAAVAPLFRPRAGESHPRPSRRCWRAWSRRRRGSRRRATSTGAQKRSRLVLQAMADTGVITPAARARGDARRGRCARSAKVPTGTYFADWVAPAAQKAFEADYGEVKVPTTLDADLQRLAVRADRQCRRSAMPRRRWWRCGPTAGSSRWSAAEATRRARSTAPPRRGASRDRRSSCSSISPRCAPATRPTSMIEDTPITIDGWTPANSDGVYRGSITLREAFARSSNAAAVRLSERVGRDNVLRAARELGISLAAARLAERRARAPPASACSS